MIDYDISNAKEDAEVLLYVTDGERVGVVLARLHWFEEGNMRALRWQATFDGSELPKGLKPFAFMVPPEADLGAA